MLIVESEMARRDYDLPHNLADTFCNAEKSDFSPEMVEQVNSATWLMASSSKTTRSGHRQAIQFYRRHQFSGHAFSRRQVLRMLRAGRVPIGWQAITGYHSTAKVKDPLRPSMSLCVGPSAGCVG